MLIKTLKQVQTMQFMKPSEKQTLNSDLSDEFAFQKTTQVEKADVKPKGKTLMITAVPDSSVNDKNEKSAHVPTMASKYSSLIAAPKQKDKLTSAQRCSSAIGINRHRVLNSSVHFGKKKLSSSIGMRNKVKNHTNSEIK